MVVNRILVGVMQHEWVSGESIWLYTTHDQGGKGLTSMSKAFVYSFCL